MRVAVDTYMLSDRGGIVREEPLPGATTEYHEPFRRRRILRAREGAPVDRANAEYVKKIDSDQGAIELRNVARSSRSADHGGPIAGDSRQSPVVSLQIQK